MKSAVVFNERFWGDEAFEVFTDTLPHYIYHATQNQPAKLGVLTSYTTGDLAETFFHLTKEQQVAEICQAISPIFGDIAEHKAKRTTDYYWGNDRYTKGAYAIFQRFDGIRTTPLLKQPVNNIFFAGEHTSTEFQGFMEGAVESGAHAAEQILSR